MNTGFDRRHDQPLSASRVIDEVCRHPVITGVAVVGAAVTLGALLHYGPVRRRQRSLFERLGASMRSLIN